MNNIMDIALTIDTTITISLEKYMSAIPTKKMELLKSGPFIVFVVCEYFGHVGVSIYLCYLLIVKNTCIQ